MLLCAQASSRGSISILCGAISINISGVALA